jgi:hypothetical protein
MLAWWRRHPECDRSSQAEADFRLQLELALFLAAVFGIHGRRNPDMTAATGQWIR